MSRLILMKVIIFLAISSTLQYEKIGVIIGNKRIEQYIQGLKIFFQQYNTLSIKPDIILFDNTVAKLPDELLQVIPTNNKITIKCQNINNIGKINKGAGLIEQWKVCSNIISNYKYIIHFEPRLQLLKTDMFENFFNSPRNLFTIGSDYKHFNTGLFCCESRLLLNFIDKIDLIEMCNKYISLEYLMFDFFKNYDIIDKMNVLWHDVACNKYLEM